MSSVVRRPVVIEYENGKPVRKTIGDNSWVNDENKTMAWLGHWGILLVIIIIGSFTIFL